MRQTISGLLAAIAVLSASAAPALACGFGQACAPAVYVAPVCTIGCGGWGYDRLPDPVLQYHSAPRVHQYYYVNQGPTYTGPGAFAPFPTYQASAYYDGVIEGPRVYSYRAPARYHQGARVLRRYY
jgi:hypothetical protein